MNELQRKTASRKMRKRWRDPAFRTLMATRPSLWRYSLEQQKVIAGRFASGESALKLAAEHGCRSDSIYKIVRRMGGSSKKRIKGRYIDKQGYAYVLAPKHPMALSNGYVAEHRLVMSQLLGRSLTPEETVHHVDGNKQNNQPENLQLRHGRHGTGVVLMCRCCGSTDVIETRLSESTPKITME